MLHHARRFLSGAALAAVAAVALPTGAHAAPEGRLVAALSSDVATLDPTIYHAIISFHARLNIFDALTDIGEKGPVPRYATSWEAAPDATAWTFTIRTDGKFHNGQPVTAEDVMFSFQKILDDQKSPTRVYVNKIKTIEKLAENKIRFNMIEPVATFDRLVSLIMIIPRKAYEEMGSEKFGQAPIGSGPYRLVRWVKDDNIEMEAFPGWWGGEVSVKTVILRPVPNEAARAAGLSSGQIDVVPALPPALVESLSNRPGIKVVKGDSYKVVYMGFDPANPALKDVRMRQAIDMAVDRAAITEKLLRGGGKPVGQIVAATTFGHDPAIRPTAYDPAKAKELVAASGYKGEKITFQYPSDFIIAANSVAEAVAGYLKAAGINVEMQGLEYNSFYSLWSAKKLNGIHLFVFGPSHLDADTPIFSVFHTSGNRGYIFDPRVDALAVRTRSETDPVKRAALISQIWKTADEYKPFSYLYSEGQAVGLRDKVTWTPTADGYLRMWTVKMAK